MTRWQFNALLFAIMAGAVRVPESPKWLAITLLIAQIVSGLFFLLSLLIVQYEFGREPPK